MPKYNAEQTVEMVNAYTAAKTDEDRAGVVENMAEKMGTTARSIIAKLSREGVYQKAERVSKAGGKVEKKDEIADEIAAAIGMAPELCDSLGKVNKRVLVAIRDNLTATSEG